MNTAEGFKLLMDSDFSRNNARLLRAAAVSVEWDHDGTHYYFPDASVLVVPNRADSGLATFDATYFLTYVASTMKSSTQDRYKEELRHIEKALVDAILATKRMAAINPFTADDQNPAASFSYEERVCAVVIEDRLKIMRKQAAKLFTLLGGE